MWDLLMITAGNEQQKQDFELQLKNLHLSTYCTKVQVVADKGIENVRIGSGGATISVVHDLRFLYKKSLDNMKILLIHSGGLSQRMPFLSCFGKIFANLPGGDTVLEVKLKIYSKLLSCVSPGLVVAASDVLEDLNSLKSVKENTEFLLFANESDLSTASQHGVFVMEKNELKCVLQKPTINEMKKFNAIQPNGLVLTDCFYWMSWSLCDRLSALQSKPLFDEICCYGDFMRPLGVQPSLNYLNEGSTSQKEWRQALAEIFKSSVVEVCNLGQNSFFHLGTPTEFLLHLLPSSSFSKKFLTDEVGPVFSQTKKSTIGNGTFLEYCWLEGCDVGENCILSDLESKTPISIEDNLIVFTIAVQEGYVTIAIETNQDIKSKQHYRTWECVREQKNLCSLWDSEQFLVANTREESLHMTLEMRRSNFNKKEYLGKTRFSIAQTVRSKVLPKMESYRENLRVLCRNFSVDNLLVQGAGTGSRT